MSMRLVSNMIRKYICLQYPDTLDSSREHFIDDHAMSIFDSVVARHGLGYSYADVCKAVDEKIEAEANGI